MKKLLLIMASLIATSPVFASYYFQQYHVSVSYSFVAYAAQPSMCVYNKQIPRWYHQCGIQASMVSGCSWNQFGYMCGGQQMAQTLCAWRLSFQNVQVVDYCGRW